MECAEVQKFLRDYYSSSTARIAPIAQLEIELAKHIASCQECQEVYDKLRTLKRIT